MQIFKNNADHLLAELAWVDALIRCEVARFRSPAQSSANLFKGMYIADDDVDRLLHETIPDTGPESDELRANANALAIEIAARAEATLDAGIPLALPHLARLFGLGTLEQQLVVLCLAPEVDAKYERLFGYLHDDISRRRATPGLALRLLCSSNDGRMAALPLFSPQAKLFRSGVIRALKPAEETLSRRSLVLDEGVAGFLLGVPGMPNDLQACLNIFSTPYELPALRWAPAMKDQLLRLITQSAESAQAKPGLLIHFYGPRGTGRKTLAATLCRAVGFPLVVVDVAELLRRFPEAEAAIQGVFRYALLIQCPVYFEGFDLVAGEEGGNSSQLQSFRKQAADLSWLTFLGTEKPWKPADVFESHTLVSVELPAPEAKDRKAIWQEFAAPINVAPDVDWDAVAGRFRLTPGRIRAAVATADAQARLRQGQNSPVSLQDLCNGCHSQSNHKLGTLAQKIVARHGWQDIILPANAVAQLREICGQLKYKYQIYSEWGFGAKLSSGKGLCVLFYGQSGVGKTMAAEVLACELGLEMYKIDLSTVVSKYIGETEKNLSRIFQEAEDSNAILFFDEADALFGKRSEVKDAHDRYANIEINYLLQRMEDFGGLAVLATNLRSNIDDGFFRRMHFAVEFPFPDESHRFRIWQQHFPKQAPLADDIDLDYLAKRFTLSGGNIRNVVVNAAFLAVANSGRIHMEHLVRATRREYEKIGRLCTEAEFAPYQWALSEERGSGVG